MINITHKKKEALERLSTTDGRINVLAIDQRGALKKMFAVGGIQPSSENIKLFKQIVSEELTSYVSAILLDPEYGVPAATVRHRETGLILAYEKTSYDVTTPGRLPDLLEDWSVLRLKNQDANAIKLLLYYDVDEEPRINHYKQVYVERVGSECEGEEIPFLLEIVSYDTKVNDTGSKKYAKLRPHKVIDAMKEFSKPQYKVDLLKVEAPVNMSYVDGFSTSAIVHTQEEAADFFREQSMATPLPFVLLSAGAPIRTFQNILIFAKKSGSTFNGVLCGRASWRNGVNQFIEYGHEAARKWFRTEGKESIQEFSGVVKQTASSWREKISLRD